MARRGLTLIELLIVIGVISLLMALSLPALVRVRNQAQGTVCTQNLRTLSLAWLLYKDDNDDRLVGGQVGKYPHDWVQKPTGAGSMLERQKEGIRQGALYHYAGKNVDVYRCPADQRKLIPGQIAFCSYSIPGGANGEIWDNAYVQAERYSEIHEPATKYVFVEEADPRGWNQGSWVLNPRGGTWVDPLAIWHSRARSTPRIRRRARGNPPLGGSEHCRNVPQAGVLLPRPGGPGEGSAVHDRRFPAEEPRTPRSRRGAAVCPIRGSISPDVGCPRNDLPSNGRGTE